MRIHSKLDVLPWGDIVSVKIRTSGEGPFGEDVYWQFHLSTTDSFFEIPGSWIEGRDFSGLSDRLAGMNYQKVIEAMACTDDAVFDVWTRDDQSGCTVNVLEPS